MARLSMNEVTTYRWSFEEDATQYAAAGYTAIGVWRQKLSDFGEEKGAALLSELGLSVSNVGWAGGFTGSEGRTHAEAVDDAREAIRTASLLNAGCLVLYTGARGGHTHNHARRLTVDAIKQLVPLAEEHHVRLALEPMHAGCGSEWTFLHCLEETVALLDQVNHELVGLVFDTYHFGHDPRILEFIPQMADKLFVVQLGDSTTPPQQDQDRTRLGEGNLPLREIIACLMSNGYDGDFDVELIGEEICAQNYTTLLHHSKAAFRDLIPSAV